MKKSIFLMAGLIGFALTSCEEDNSLGTMQKNEAPQVVVADGVAIESLYTATGNKINLQNFEQVGEVPLVDIEIDATFPENSTVMGQVEIADNPDFTNAQTITMNAVEASAQNADLTKALGVPSRSFKGVVSCLDWNDAFVSFYGLNPAEKVNYLRYRLWLVKDKQNVILYDDKGNEWFDSMQFDVTPIDAKLDVASSYVLHYITNGADEQQIVMYHNPDNHVYDDPVFSANVEVGETDGVSDTVLWWITQENNGKPFGVVGNPAELTGNLAQITGVEGIGSGQISTAGVYKIEVNMLELTYTVKLAPPSLYVVSTSYITFENCAQLGTDDNVLYTGMAGIESAWGLTGQAAYKPTFYSNNTEIEATTSNGTVTGGLIFDESGAPLNSNSAIPLPGQRGLFYVTANLQSLTYTAYRCNTMGITGSLMDLGWNDDVELKNSRTTQYMVYTGQITVKAGDEWKIRANGDWAVNFGGNGSGSYTTDGAPIELAMGGDNLVAAEDGTYNVTINFRRTLQDGKMTPYYMTVTKAE